MTQQVGYPYGFDNRGRTTDADYRNHIRQLVQQLLFTVPGERVMRPTFGCGLKQLVFGPNGTEIGAASEMLVQASLQEWLGELIEVNSVEVETEDATLRVTIDYGIRASGEQQLEQFSAGIGP